MMPQFPIYIVSKDRWQPERRLTSQVLERMRVPHFIVVEPSEFELYRAAVNPEITTVLELDIAYKSDYDTFDDLGDSKGKGPGAARNLAWDHAISNGHTWHWVMDDNIRRFQRLNRNKKINVATGAFFRAMEDFVLRYTNVAMAGPNYRFFAKQRQELPPFITNTRIYSCNLIRNDVPYRWRGRYNEDTDLSLRMLKDGWCTVQFNAFLQDKQNTQQIPGGNTAEFYSLEGTQAKSEMQVKMHPDVSRIVWKFNRIHHHVDYTPFEKTRLKRRPDVEIPTGVNEYGMKLVRIAPENPRVQT